MTDQRLHPLIPSLRTVAELQPGMVIAHTGRTATVITTCPHPLHQGFTLVVWRLDDGTTSLDALSPRQEVGDEVLGDRRAALRAALNGGRDVPR